MGDAEPEALLFEIIVAVSGQRIGEFGVEVAPYSFGGGEMRGPWESVCLGDVVEGVVV
jgi:hypothetical protein